MKKITILFVIMLCAITGTHAQHKKMEQKSRRRHFSPEEFQARQREYITDKAELTAEEAEAFFPIFFELQKKKFSLEREARKGINMKRGEKMSEEQCRQFVDKMGDVKIEVAKLEKEYCTKYLKVLPACKLMRIQHAEISFQRDLMKRMPQHQGFRNKPGEKR